MDNDILIIVAVCAFSAGFVLAWFIFWLYWAMAEIKIRELETGVKKW